MYCLYGSSMDNLVMFLDAGGWYSDSFNFLLTVQRLIFISRAISLTECPLACKSCITIKSPFEIMISSIFLGNQSYYYTSKWCTFISGDLSTIRIQVVHFNIWRNSKLMITVVSEQNQKFLRFTHGTPIYRLKREFLSRVSILFFLN